MGRMVIRMGSSFRLGDRQYEKLHFQGDFLLQTFSCFERTKLVNKALFKLSANRPIKSDMENCQVTKELLKEFILSRIENDEFHISNNIVEIGDYVIEFKKKIQTIALCTLVCRISPDGT